ncbi:hypothetical protein ACP179_01120 (plasmid) [Xenorhabdus stockiae]|uniref:hypothetical protein n=1 Tax=Xenorhabdus stockiae TaxID=351614 RepID=UPI003CE944C4
MPNRVYLSVPLNIAIHEITLVLITEGYKNAGYSISNPLPFSLEGAKLESLVARVCMLSLASEIWFPKDFERDPVCVAEYNYAYVLMKKIRVDERRLLLD